MINERKDNLVKAVDLLWKMDGSLKDIISIRYSMQPNSNNDYIYIEVFKDSQLAKKIRNWKRFKTYNLTVSEIGNPMLEALIRGF